MKNYSLNLALLLLCAWLGAGMARAAYPGEVVMWGNNYCGQATVTDEGNRVSSIESSGDLQLWSTVVPLTDDSFTTTSRDHDATNSRRRFYRALIP